MRLRLLAAATLLAAAPSAAPAGPTPPPTGAVVATGLGTFDSLGAWVDMYNSGPWDHPRRTVARLAERGVRTLYLETGNYKKRSTLYRPRALAALLDEAHAAGIAVVAWYVPSFSNNDRDFRRIKAAITLRTGEGNSFDGFAMDIEATVVEDIPLRNRRMLALSDRVRALAGPAYPLAAITPDPVSQRYWPGFPYAEVARRYDGFLPMAYWTYRTSGAANVYDYTSAAVRIVRRETGDPVHVIGGISSDASVREVRAFARAAADRRALGASLYDYPITNDRQWRELARVTALGD